MQRIEQVVDRLADTTALPKPPAPKPAPPVRYLDSVTRAAAWGIVVLLFAVPLLATIAVRSRLLWGMWAVISLWAALDSRNLGAALPKRPMLSDGTLVLALALLNLLTALCAIFLPVAR